MTTIVLLTCLLGMTSCGGDDELNIGYTDPTDNFSNAAGDTDESEPLRKTFFEEQGSYLLFNDTLQHRYLGKDPNGEDRYFTELLDIGYTVGTTTAYRKYYTYTYLSNQEQKEMAVDYLKRFILNHLSENLKPFAWLLVGKMESKNAYGYPVTAYAASGQRAIVLACSQLPSLKTDALKERLATRHLNVVLSNLANNNRNKLNEFTDYCSDLYGYTITVPAGMTRVQYLRSRGFTGEGTSIGFPSREEDINMYATLVLNNSDEKIAQTYKDYPLVIERAAVYKRIMTELGYIF